MQYIGHRGGALELYKLEEYDETTWIYGSWRKETDGDHDMVFSPITAQVQDSQDEHSGYSMKYLEQVSFPEVDEDYFQYPKCTHLSYTSENAKDVLKNLSSIAKMIRPKMIFSSSENVSY